jgi:hypothetical protein
MIKSQVKDFMLSLLERLFFLPKLFLLSIPELKKSMKPFGLHYITGFTDFLKNLFLFTCLLNIFSGTAVKSAL